MEYKASMDRTTGIITGLIILLIARIAYLEGRHILNVNAIWLKYGPGF
jgi:hypothetical protein